MKTILKIVIACFIAGVIGLVACTALVGGAVNQAQKDSDKHAITTKQYKQAKMGMPYQDVRSILGIPDSTDHQQVKGLKMDCIYYNQLGHLASMYQFCFDNGHLSSKSQY